MREEWVKVVDSLLRPVRARLAEHRAERERLFADFAAARTRATADCERRIDALRAEVFAARDGIVTTKMTELEREWRRLSRGDRDGEIMQLWARIAPAGWLDQKRWRDAPLDAQIDTAVLLASDPEGVELAEREFSKERIRWQPLGPDFEGMPALVGGSRLDQRVHDQVLARFPDRPHLARAVGLAAHANVRRYCDIWRAGYVVGARDEVSVTLEFPTA